MRSHPAITPGGQVPSPTIHTPRFGNGEPTTHPGGSESSSEARPRDGSGERIKPDLSFLKTQTC